MYQQQQPLPPAGPLTQPMQPVATTPMQPMQPMQPVYGADRMQPNQGVNAGELGRGWNTRFNQPM
jgi:hypothetical protein